jgi:hypothetical protein
MATQHKPFHAPGAARPTGDRSAATVSEQLRRLGGDDLRQLIEILALSACESERANASECRVLRMSV